MDGPSSLGSFKWGKALTNPARNPSHAKPSSFRAQPLDTTSDKYLPTTSNNKTPAAKSINTCGNKNASAPSGISDTITQPKMADRPALPANLTAMEASTTSG